MSHDMILHVDGDGFFAACEVARRPDLRGKPVVVGEDRGIACAMTYEAKRLGITRAKPIFEIRKEFPQVIILSSHFELYEMYSEKLYRILRSHLDTVEWYSIDECFAVMPASFMLRHGSWHAALKFIKESVQEQLGITCSFGIADTKVLAKIASKYEKPDGCTVLLESDREAVLAKVFIESVWGIGWQTAPRLRKLGISTALHLAKYNEKHLINFFREPLHDIWCELRGKRMYSIHTEYSHRKSLQATQSFAPASTDSSFIYSELSRNIEIVCKRLRGQGLAAKSFGVYIDSKMVSRHYTSAQITLPFYTQNPVDVLRAVQGLWSTLYLPQYRYRSTGVSAYGLIPQGRIPWDLFECQQKKLEKDQYLLMFDQIQKKFGYESISLGSSLKSIEKRKNEQRARDEKDFYIWNLPLPYLGEVN
jgi:nucleotidyltransferase/DNA polymerase involved in DNA repair